MCRIIFFMKMVPGCCKICVDEACYLCEYSFFFSYGFFSSDLIPSSKLELLLFQLDYYEGLKWLTMRHRIVL